MFGFDTHGVPIEFEIEKELKIKSVQDIKKIGIAKYNEACRGIVMRCKDEWVKTMRRLGRWVDMKNDYKTMDLTFMESVWWVFSQLFKKGYVYRGYKVCPYSMGCATPLSNFEAKENYKDTSDYSIIVIFPLATQKKVNVLVWTTTPWTLPANLMLCVNPTLKYHYLEYQDEMYIVEETCTEKVFENKKYSIVKSVLGLELVGLKYLPPFDYYLDTYSKNDLAFTICEDRYVLGGNGTGIVHQAPAFGEDDYRVCLKAKVISKSDTPPCPIDENGNYVYPVSGKICKSLLYLKLTFTQ